MPLSLSPRQKTAISRMAWEERNRPAFDRDFQETQAAGCDRHKMLFVKAQEAALASIAGGLFDFEVRTDFANKTMISRMVLAVLDHLKEVNHESYSQGQNRLHKAGRVKSRVRSKKTSIP